MGAGSLLPRASFWPGRHPSLFSSRPDNTTPPLPSLVFSLSELLEIKTGFRMRLSGSHGRTASPCLSLLCPWDSQGTKPLWPQQPDTPHCLSLSAQCPSPVSDLSFALGCFLLQAVAVPGAEASVLRCGCEEQRATFLRAIFPLRLVTQLTGKLGLTRVLACDPSDYRSLL